MRRNLLSSRYKKGNIFLDGIVFFIVLFVFIIIGVFSFLTFGEINKELTNDDFLGDEAKSMITTNVNNFPDWLDSAFVFLLVLFWIITLALTFVIDSHPVFFVFALIILIFLIFVGAVLSNAYYDISQDDDVLEYSSQLPKIQWLMDRLPVLIITVMMSMLIVFGIKSRL